jgi:hypothetical protein
VHSSAVKPKPACNNTRAVPEQASANVRDRRFGVTRDRDLPRSAAVVAEWSKPVTPEVAGFPFMAQRREGGTVASQPSPGSSR